MKKNNDPRPPASQPAPEHADREGQTAWSGHQPASKCSNDEGNKDYTQKDALTSSARTGLQKK